MSIIGCSGHDLLSTIEDILDYTQLEADETTRHIDAFHLIDVIAKVDKKLKLETLDISLLSKPYDRLDLNAALSHAPVQLGSAA